ncbi:MAG: carbon-nitrogen hydrolase family protein [Thermodesulfobacteriota bacterium]
MRIAAIQMTARTADVPENLAQAESLVREAAKKKAEWVILPEFFSSGMAFHPDLISAVRPADGEPLQMMQRLARELFVVVGGSFLAATGSDVKNRFFLVFPDGRMLFHDKDQPTMWENCYYVGGNDDGVLDAGDVKAGASLCWEFVRTRTAKRLRGKVDLVVGGSCWWSLPERTLPGFPQSLAARMQDVADDSPGRMARLLGVPVVHSAHAGEFAGKMPLIPGFPFVSHLVGGACIVDRDGKTLVRLRREEGRGVVVSDLDLSAAPDPSEVLPESFWIPNLPSQIRLVWAYQNFHGSLYYRWVTKGRLAAEGLLS